MYLSMFDVEKLPKIYSWYIDPIDCSYYYDPMRKTSLQIFVKRSMPHSVKELYCFELIKDHECYFLNVHTNKSVNMHCAGKKKEEVKEFVVNAVSKKTCLKSERWEEAHLTLIKNHSVEQREVKKILRELIDAFFEV